MHIHDTIAPYYEGYAEAMIESSDDTPIWLYGKNAPTPRGFLRFLREEVGAGADDPDVHQAWNMYLAHLKRRYGIAYQKACDGYILNAFTEDSEEWANATTVADIRAGAHANAEAEWEHYL